MLIVNADDWGYDLSTTEAIARAFQAGRITSATAMIFMRDSERAAPLASRESMPVGLHLNLMEAYSATDIPEEARVRQQQVVAAFRASQRCRWLPSRKLSSLVQRCVADQLNGFAQLYATAPTHIDGHQHGHLSTPVLRALSRDRRRAVRSSFTFRAGEKSLLNRALRFALNNQINARFRSTRKFYSIRTLHPRLGGYGLEDALAEAHVQDVEIMVHPGWSDELELLMSDQWRTLLAGVPLGSFRDLPSSP